MNEQWGRAGSKTLTFLIVGAMVPGLFADGYRNPPPTAEGIGKSGANMVFVNDASAIFYNPANLAGIESASVVFNVTLARTESTYTSAYTGTPAESDADWVALPNFFIGAPVGNNGFAVGLGISTPFGQGSSYAKNDLMNIPAFTNGAPPAIHEGEIALININPTVAFQVNEKISVAVGLDIYYSTLNFKQYYPWQGNSPFPADQNAEADGEGYGLGGNAAITWNVTQRQRLAFIYRSEVKVEYEGDLKVDIVGVAVPPQLINSSFAMDIIYPTTLGAGYGIALSDKIHVEANLEWLGWSANESQTANLGSNGSLTIPQNWEDTFTFGIGGDWQFAEQWVARAGYAFIESPVPNQTMAPILPDADRHALSLGLGYTTGGHTLDVAYTFSIYDDRNISAGENLLFPGSYDIDSNLVGLTYSYSF